MVVQIRKRKIQRPNGFTMTEFLVILTLMALLGIMLLFGFDRHQSRARDARRKADLEKIKISFEDYYNDNNCYPPEGILNNCNGNQLSPYLAQIPCDPFTKQPYVYLPNEGNICKGYRILTGLEDEHDPIIAESGCATTCGCGYGLAYNYGVSAGMPLTIDACSPIVPPEPVIPEEPDPETPEVPVDPEDPSDPEEPVTDYYACAPDGNCNIYYDPIGAGCPVTFNNYASCQPECSTPANRCVE